MDEQIMDASAIDDLNDYDLTGEIEDIEPISQEDDNQNNDDDANNQNDIDILDNLENLDNDTDIEDDEDDFTLKVLLLKGITDPSKIKFEDESGAIVERDWNDLTDSERLNILAGTDDPERDLEDDEIRLINLLRENELTPQQYILAIQAQAYNLAIAQYQLSQIPTYEIDSLSDDELFALDLLEKVGEENISDEELKEALETAKANPSLFEKLIDGLRATYKNLEDLQRYDAEQALIEQAELQYLEFSTNVLNEIGSFNSFANQEIELSTDDKNDLANYLLTRRDTGLSDFYTDMLNPSTATLAAFWLLKGPEVLNEMEEQIKAAYLRGFALGKTQNTLEPTPKASQVVVLQKLVIPPSNTDFLSAFSLEDESYLQ